MAMPAASGANAAGANNANYVSASLYVGDLAPDVTEGLLFELFNTVGPVVSIRVCRDAMLKRSLGYAYVNFHNQADAERALDTMNYSMIKGRACRIMWSQRDPSLRKSGVGNIFVRNLAPDVHHKELFDAFSLFGNILSCKVALEPDGKSKGYGYVHYETEEAAKEALAKMKEIEIQGKPVEVCAFQKRERRPDVLEWTNLYVKNIPLEWDDAAMRTEFEQFGEVTSCKVMVYSEADVAARPDKNLTAGASKGFGFICYADHPSAKQAVETLNGKKFDPPEGSPEGTEPREMYVSRAQKKTERERELRKQFAEKNAKMQHFSGVNLYIKNIDDNMTDKDLRTTFEKFGTITSSKVMKHADGSSKGFGFVCFSSPEEAVSAQNEMNGKMVMGKPIFVALAQRGEVRREHLATQFNAGMARGQMPGMPGRGMPMGYGAVPMMYPGMQNPNGRGPPYPMPAMMMAGPRGMPRPMPGAAGYRQGAPPYQMPAYPGAQQMMPGQQQGGRGSRRARGQNQGRGGPGRGNQQGQPQRQNQQIKFNEQARNQGRPPMQPGAPGAVPMQGGPMPPAAMQPGPAPMPQQAPAPVPEVKVPVSNQLTLSALRDADPQERKNMIGERLYPLIHQSQPELAGKITGMLLEMDNSELLHLLESPDALTSKIAEALEVLEQHNRNQEE